MTDPSANLETLVGQLCVVPERMNGNGLDILFRDSSESAGHRYGFTFDLVQRALSNARLIDVSEEEKIKRCQDALEVANAYLSEDKKVFPENFVPSILGEVSAAEQDSNEIVGLMRENVYHVLENLNKNAKYLLEQHDHQNKGYHFAGTYGQLHSALVFSMRKDVSAESRICAMVSALSSTFDHAVFVVGMPANFLEYLGNDATRENIKRLFKGYRDGPKLARGGYVPETNVEQFCRTKEPVILSAPNLGEVNWYGPNSTSRAIQRN